MGLSLKEVVLLPVLSRACREPCRRVEGPSRRVEELIDVN